MWHVPPWELEQRISSEWFTRMQAFDQEFTLDPEGWRQAGQISWLQARGLGDKRTKPKDWIPVHKPTEQQTDDHMEMLMRAFANKGKKKKKKQKE